MENKEKEIIISLRDICKNGMTRLHLKTSTSMCTAEIS